jgi:hypothetical protein
VGPCPSRQALKSKRVDQRLVSEKMEVMRYSKSEMMNVPLLILFNDIMTVQYLGKKRNDWTANWRGETERRKQETEQQQQELETVKV